MPITPLRTGPKTKRMAQDRFYRLMYDWSLENDHTFLDTARRHVPEAWHVLEMDLDVEEPKEKVTLYLDKSVARMFRGMGRGYHARINRVLATWVQMKIAEMKALDKEHMDALSAAAHERDAPDHEPSERRPKELCEHWAYLQGLIDGDARKG